MRVEHKIVGTLLLNSKVKYGVYKDKLLYLFNEYSFIELLKYFLYLMDLLLKSGKEDVKDDIKEDAKENINILYTHKNKLHQTDKGISIDDVFFAVW